MMALNSPLRLAVLLSGTGTSLQNLLDRCADGRLSAQVAVVIANRSDAFGLERARRANIPAVVVERKAFGSQLDFSRQIFEHCRGANADLVCLAGFLQLLVIPDDFALRVMNVHPALIPAFCGKGYYGHRVHQAVLEYGVKVSGCTVHFADNVYDHGPIILQRVVPVLDDDSADTLAARVQEAEREAYPEAIQLFAEGRLLVEGRKVWKVRSRQRAPISASKGESLLVLTERMSSIGFTPQLLQSRSIRFLPEADASIIETIKCGVLFVMAFWSGPARQAYTALRKTLEEVDPTGSLELVVVDTDGIPDIYSMPEFLGKMCGAGETTWIKDGRIVSTTAGMGFRPDLFEPNTRALLAQCQPH